MSVIVSAHNSAAFLPICLDSILGQDFTDIELIAVDDASTDDTPRVLDRYAQRDPRVRMIRLDSNVGAGGARNAALDCATGDYVWVIDSDDWIVPDALATVARAIDARQPDALLIGYARAFPDGSQTICTEQDILAVAPPTFKLHQWRDAINIMHTPWNKVVKRDLIERAGFRFPKGWHQDLPYSYAMLAGAERISAIAEPLLIYRQHVGAATATKNVGHLCVLDQWSLTFELVERLSARPELLRRPLLDRMAWHLTEQLKQPDRLPMRAWPEFARRAHLLWQSLVPRDYAFPRGLTGLKYRLLAHHPTVIPLLPRLFALRRAARRAVGMKRDWDLPAAPRAPAAGARNGAQPHMVKS